MPVLILRFPDGLSDDRAGIFGPRRLLSLFSKGRGRSGSGCCRSTGLTRFLQTSGQETPMPDSGGSAGDSIPQGNAGEVSPDSGIMDLTTRFRHI